MITIMYHNLPIPPYVFKDRPVEAWDESGNMVSGITSKGRILKKGDKYQLQTKYSHEDTWCNGWYGTAEQLELSEQDIKWARNG